MSSDFHRCYACYAETNLAKHEKTPDGAANVTHVTDVTANRRGCTYRPPAGARPPERYIDTPLSNGVTSVTSVTSPPPYSGFRDPFCRNIGDHVTPASGTAYVSLLSGTHSAPNHRHVDPNQFNHRRLNVGAQATDTTKRASQNPSCRQHEAARPSNISMSQSALAGYIRYDEKRIVPRSICDERRWAE